ncbi:gluconate 2-dehydrogenase subunit 3 family protein [Hymenobacter taeanensis]|uniref:Gluconate 2-dehydrogenase subunit 3 family protein n=1 Tax=Hymenobacter taeanensis TaxID=2735321 RepID=A0A6M6BFE7_9BACT|nr:MULTISPECIES: gluconate 2-dehydrogenase subunit 3 family protein [Hymenobacter]QJX46558.1 gluconate 2-dehydrogenase subunit 3 family protein [Hymenobacter taeanensis]UOQ80417.1 gluconate 2-dehydrogenase subunit 3 family protein [Hymenobacter sp. 5414T-23]
MASPHYPEGTVRALLQTELVTEATRAALLSRLDTSPYTPQFFDEGTYELLRAVAARIYPQPERAEPIELAPVVDKRLAEGDSDGWRYDAMPPDREAYRLGLGGINQAAQALFQLPFQQLPEAQQDQVMEVIANGTAPGENWQQLPINRFFEELLAELTEAYYSHPLAQEEIGYVGMADVPGWTHIEPNQLEPREPEAVKE